MKLFQLYDRTFINTDYIVSIDKNTVYMSGNEYTKFKYELSSDEISRLLQFIEERAKC